MCIQQKSAQTFGNGLREHRGFFCIGEAYVEEIERELREKIEEIDQVSRTAVGDDVRVSGLQPGVNLEWDAVCLCKRAQVMKHVIGEPAVRAIYQSTVAFADRLFVLHQLVKVTLRVGFRGLVELEIALVGHGGFHREQAVLQCDVKVLFERFLQGCDVRDRHVRQLLEPMQTGGRDRRQEPVELAREAEKFRVYRPRFIGPILIVDGVADFGAFFRT